MRDSALERFMARVAEARELLSTIQAHVDDHFGVDPEDVHWGHVAEAGDVAQRLQVIVGDLEVGKQAGVNKRADSN